LRGFSDVDFTHILKDKVKGFGHIHFNSEDDASLFFHSVRADLTYKGPNGRVITFKRAKYYRTGIDVEYKSPIANRDVLRDLEDEPLQRNNRRARVSINQPLNSNVEAEHDVENLPPPHYDDGDQQSSQAVEEHLSKRTGKPLSEFPNQKEETRLPSRKRRAEASAVDHIPRSGLPKDKEKVQYRVYEESEHYIIVVNTPSVDNKKDLVIRYEECTITVAWNYICEVAGSILKDYIPEAMAEVIELPERIDQKTAVVKIGKGVVEILVKKLFENDSDDDSED